MDRANEIKAAGDADRIIAEELERLLESPLFLRSPVLSRLLQFLVEHRLRGGRASPKAYAIATEALGRSADFDPAVDSYPRVMVGRLRSLLDRYYAEMAWKYRLRVPQGSYEVVVQYRASPPSRPAGERAPGPDVGAAERMPPTAAPPRAASAAPRYGLWLVGLLIVGFAMLAGWRLVTGQPGLFGRAPVPMPLLEVTTPVSGDTPVSRAIARAVDSKLRDGLRRFDLVDLRSAGAPEGGGVGEVADYRLDVSLVRDLQGPVDVTLVLNRVGDQRTIWSQQVRLTEDDAPGFRTIEPVIAQIAGDYGVIVRDQLQRQPENFTPGFPCLAQFNRMRQMRNSTNARQVEACLRATLDGNRNDPVTLMALSLLRFGDWQPRRDTAVGRTAFAEAHSLAERAYQSGPNTTAGLFAMARAHFYDGNCRAGNTMGDAAVRQNPHDPDMAGFLGLFKVACGQDAEGEALLQRSVDLDASHPGVPAVTLAFILAQKGEADQAMAILDQIPAPSNLEPQYLMARSVVLARQGKLTEARAHWRRLLDYTRQAPDTPPEQVLRQFMISPTVIERAAAAVRDSGVSTVAPAR